VLGPSAGAILDVFHLNRSDDDAPNDVGQRAGRHRPAVRRLKPPEVGAALIKRIDKEEGDEDERELAIDAVKEFRMVEAVPVLLKQLRNGKANGMVRGKAAQALARCNAKETLPEIIALARLQDNDFRHLLIPAMGRPRLERRHPGNPKGSQGPGYVGPCRDGARPSSSWTPAKRWTISFPCCRWMMKTSARRRRAGSAMRAGARGRKPCSRRSPG